MMNDHEVIELWANLCQEGFQELDVDPSDLLGTATSESGLS